MGGVPARRERGRVEALGGGERTVGALVGVAPEHSAQHPLARQPDEVELVVAQSELALRMEVEVDRHLLDQRGIGGCARRLLELVRHQRGQHLDLAHARADGNSDPDGGRADNHPGQLYDTRPAGESTDDRNGEHDDPLDVVRARLCLFVAREQAASLGGRADALVAEQHLVDRPVHEPADGADERIARSARARARLLPGTD